jgi:hypothetical protein
MKRTVAATPDELIKTTGGMCAPSVGRKSEIGAIGSAQSPELHPSGVTKSRRLLGAPRTSILRNEPELVGLDFTHNILRANILRLSDRKSDSGSFSEKWPVTKVVANGVPHPSMSGQCQVRPVVERSVDRGGGFARLRAKFPPVIGDPFLPFDWAAKIH